MEFQRTKNTIRNTSVAFIEKLLAIFLPFLVRTIIIHKMGIEYTGLNSLFTNVLSLINFVDIGFSSAILHFLYKPVSEDDEKTINAILHFLKKIYKVIGCVLLVVGIIVSFFVKYLIKDGTYPNDINLYILYFIFLINTIAPYFFGGERICVLEVYQVGYKKNLVNICLELIKTSLQVVVLLVFANYYIYSLLIAISSILLNIICFLIARKDYPSIHPQGTIDSNMKNEMKKKITFLFLHKVPSLITTTVDSLVISSVLGAAQLGIYGNYTLIGTSITGFFIVFYSTIKPIIGNHFFSSTKDEVNKFYDSLFFTILCASVFTVLSLFVLYQPFMNIWVGDKLLLQTPIIILLCLYYFAFLLRHFVSGIYIDITGLWNKTLLRQYLIASLNLVLDILLVKPCGIFGIVLASFVTEFLIGIPFDYYIVYKYVFKRNPFGFILPIIISLIVLVALSSGFYLITTVLPLNKYWLLIILFILLVVSGIIIYFLFIRKNEKFSFVKNHLLRFIKKR